MFLFAANKAGTSADKCFHVGDRVSKDVAGAARANWTALHLNERCDNDLPDWDAIDSEELTAEGQQARKDLLHWGRRDTATGLQWYELWGLRDILTLFGYDDDDDDKVICTTCVHNAREDNIISAAGRRVSAAAMRTDGRSLLNHTSTLDFVSEFPRVAK
jgi:hypothetical protein